MSATLGALLKELAPEWNITVFEKLSAPGEESSNEWNNAGTGHSALCELNYTVEKADGTMDISKAVKINEQFQLSRQFWSYLVNNGRIGHPEEFIRPLPHVSLVHGKDDAAFLRKRYDALSACPLFRGMSYSNDPAVLKEWLPLVMEGRDPREPLAATKNDKGTDVNFGALTRSLFGYLHSPAWTSIITTRSRISTAPKTALGLSKCRTPAVRPTFTKPSSSSSAVAAAVCPSCRNPASPRAAASAASPSADCSWVCDDPAVVDKHFAKVYGKAKVGAPPMSVPHLDTRYIDGKKSLLFGPFAGFSPKFLKTGSYFDLIGSVKPHNVINMVKCGLSELSLVKYLIQQLLLTDKARLKGFAMTSCLPPAWKVGASSSLVSASKSLLPKDSNSAQRSSTQPTAPSPLC